MQRLNNNTGQWVIWQQPSENLTVLSKNWVQSSTGSTVTTWPWPCQPGFEKSLLTNLTTVKVLGQSLCHVLHTTEFADISGHMMCCRKVHTLEFYNNSYFGYNKELLCNSVTTVNRKENQKAEERKCKIVVHKAMIGGKNQKPNHNRIYRISD